jgi:hypothetical protein
MSDETIKIDDLKDEERLKIDVDDVAPNKMSEQDIVAEFKKAGRQFAQTLEEVFTSDEAKRIETEVRAGVKGFADEVEKFIREAGDSPAAKRLQEDVGTMGKRVESSDVTQQAQLALAQGLRWLSVELDQMAGRFNAPAEKSPKDVVEEVIIEDDEVQSA